MRCLLMMSAYSVASSSVCEEADHSSLLQSRSVVRKTATTTQSGADSLLQSVKDVADSLRGSAHTMTPDAVNTAVGEASSALTTMIPSFAEQHTRAQQEVNLQFGEIEACHDSASHGVDARASHAERVANQHAAKIQCDEEQVTAIETEEQECDEWNNHAVHLYTGLPGCNQPSTPEQLFNTISEMQQFVSDNYNQVVSQRTECNEASEATTNLAEVCAARTAAYEEGFCQHHLSCHRLNQCHAHEVEVYNTLREDVEAGMIARQQQYRTVRQSECILALITTALANGTPIPNDYLTSCGDASIADLIISFPDLPSAPSECPATQSVDPDCEPVPLVLSWTNGQGDVTLQPAAGSPPECRCSQVELQGVYSAGPVIRCDDCLDVHRSTDQNSCPNGWKIFSPRSKEDWEVLGASLGEHSRTRAGNWPASPDLIIDVTKPNNGCNGCRSAMNSNNPEVPEWTTSDGSPWWMRNDNYGEPNGDYHANCYLEVYSAHPEAVTFNDHNCLKHSSSYLCQREANGAPTAIQGLNIDSSLSAFPDMPWQLALNIDTDDGNVLNYANADFWEGETELGGATSDESNAFTGDYKNPAVFSTGGVKQLLVVAHNEGETLGWRRWRVTESHSSLRDYFTTSNTCSDGGFSAAQDVQLASETIDAEEGSLDAQHEPLVTNRGENTELWVNAGGGDDWNRLSTSRNPANNLGWGLGTAYDIRSCGVTLRPQADAQLHTDNHHWGSGGGIGGLIGTDHICGNGMDCPAGRCAQCPWTVPSGMHLDYAIFVSLEG